MTFQLVRASDEDIAVWHTDHGHIYSFTVCAETDSLTRRFMRDAPDATAPAADFAEDALRFATEEARVRQLIGGRVKRRRKVGCPTAVA